MTMEYLLLVSCLMKIVCFYHTQLIIFKIPVKPCYMLHLKQSPQKNLYHYYEMYCMPLVTLSNNQSLSDTFIGDINVQYI